MSPCEKIDCRACIGTGLAGPTDGECTICEGRGYFKAHLPNCVILGRAWMEAYVRSRETGDTRELAEFGYGAEALLGEVVGAFIAAKIAKYPEGNEMRELVEEAAEIMEITYAGNFPSGIESFLVRARLALAHGEGE